MSHTLKEPTAFRRRIELAEGHCYVSRSKGTYALTFPSPHFVVSVHITRDEARRLAGTLLEASQHWEE